MTTTTDLKKNVLYVQTFGGFSISWNGKAVIGSGKSSESQFAYLMQLLLHHGTDGISRNILQQVLFADRDVENIHHSTRSVIYNAKKKLRGAGLPDVDYIEQRKGVYYWTEKIPVIEDAAMFERLCQEAEAEEEPDGKLDRYLEACHCYAGEFLPMQAGVVWVAQETRRYRSLFCSCVERAVSLLRNRHDFIRMEELGFYAARINPLADWEVITMEALVSMGRYADAGKFYNDTVELYMQEQGLRPSGRLMDLLCRMGTQMEHQYEALDAIQQKLSEEEDDGLGGYVCTYPVFQGVYRMVKRMMERGGQSVYLMLCTVVDSKGNPMKEGSMLEELSQRLGDAIRHSVRHSDAINKYGKGQYLVLLVNTTRENCDIIQKRINYYFIIGRQRTGIQYYVNSVVCTPGKDRTVKGKEKK